jgi:glutamate-1-semialdehyde 2,1-aminomutase
VTDPVNDVAGRKSGPGRYPDPAAESARLFERAKRVLPGGNTRTTVYRSPYPVYARSGHGNRIVDVDGVERIDFLNNYTALIHGHAHPSIVRAAIEAVGNGSCFGVPTESEIRLAELLVDRIPGAEKVRFMNSGSEAVMMAVKAARAYTGRPKIAKCEGVYHGSYDFVEVSLDSSPASWGDSDRPNRVPYSAGTPASVLSDVVVLPFNDIKASLRLVEENASELAAVIVDPLPNRIGLIQASSDYMTALRRFCSKAGVVLISDEVISFRVGYGGAQAEFGFQADLVALGKIIGGGFPVGAVVGRADVMAVFDPTAGKSAAPHGGTFNANPVTMAAGAAAVELLTPMVVKDLNELGRVAREKVQAVFHEARVPWRVTGRASLFRFLPGQKSLVGYRSSWMDETVEKQLRDFTNALLNHGILVDPGGLGCLSTVMSESEVDILAQAVSLALSEVQPPTLETM